MKENKENLLRLLIMSFILVLTYTAGYLVASNNNEGYSCVKEPDNEKREKVRLSNRLIEKSDVNIKCDSSEIGQKTYYNHNKDFNFKVEIPEEWWIDEYYNNNLYEIMFNFQNSGYSISIYSTETKTENDIVNETGDQFDNRVVNIRDINDYTKKVVVTTKDEGVKDWVSEKYLIKKDNFIFVIGNGAIKQAGFDSFFESFKFID